LTVFNRSTYSSKHWGS